VLPKGFHRIRHYGLLAGTMRKDSIALTRKLLAVAAPPENDALEDTRAPCPCCGGHMIVIEAFARWQQPRAPPSTALSIRNSRHDPAWLNLTPPRSRCASGNAAAHAIATGK